MATDFGSGENYLMDKGLPVAGGKTPWPPQSHEMVYRDMEVNNAWYAGDIDALETLYSTTQLVRRSGLWGQAKRFFFGTPVPGQQAQRPVKLHVPVPATISRVSSQLLYGELPKVTLEEVDDPTVEYNPPSGNSGAGEGTDAVPPSKYVRHNKRINQLLDDDFHASLLECGELGSALGGAYLRVSWDMTIVPDRPFITMVPADAAVPEFRYNHLAAVTFWMDLPQLDGDAHNYRLLERHSPGRIEWGLYQASDAKQLGIQIPLTDHPDAASLASMVDENAGIDTGSDLLTAVYIPNVKPTRMLRKDPVASKQGRSDYEGLDDLFDALDEVWTSWMRDIRLAKSRIFVSKDMIDTGVPGQGGMFDADREVWVPLKGLPSTLSSKAGAGSNNSFVQAEQFKIRFLEHQETAHALLEQIFAGGGFAPQTFGVVEKTGARTVTATQVQFQERMTNLTRQTKQLYSKPRLQHLIAALLDVDEAFFNGPGRDGQLPDVTFPDVAAPALDALAQCLQLIRAAEAASTQTLVQMMNPDWSMAQVLAEVDRIHGEMAMSQPLPGMPKANGDGNDTAGGESPESAGSDGAGGSS